MPNTDSGAGDIMTKKTKSLPIRILNSSKSVER